MKIISKTVEIKAKFPISSEYIESELKKIGIIPLRWAIVKVDCNNFAISLAFESSCYNVSDVKL